MSKTVLITGVAGLIGAHFSRYLLDRGYKVIGIENLSGGYFDFIDERVDCRFLDLNDNINETIDTVMAETKPDYVFHFAAYAAEGLSPFIRNFNYQNNVLASMRVINACINNNVKKLIFTSSMAVYGDIHPPFHEIMLPDPADPYGIAKYAVEMDLKLAKKQFGLDYTVVRPHNVIGIYQNIWDRYRNVIGIWIRQALRNEPLSIYGDGLQTRAFSDIKFLLPVLEKLMEPTTAIGYDTFNIGADLDHTILDVAEMVQSIAAKKGYQSEIIHLEERNEVKYAYCNHERAQKVLGFRDETDLIKTIEEMFTWAITQPDRKMKTMKYEIEKNMYSFWK